MSRLTLIEGPAGAGKSQVAADMIAAGDAAILADLTELWAAIRAMRRGPDGRYPIRDDDDPAIRAGLAVYLRAAAVRQALREGLPTVVTAGSPDMAARWATVAEETGAAFMVQTVDPGEAIVRARLAVDGELHPQCDRAIGRWYRQS